MTRKQWEALEGKLVHVTIIGVTPWGWDESTLKIECKIHEIDEYFEFEIEIGEE